MFDIITGQTSELRQSPRTRPGVPSGTVPFFQSFAVAFSGLWDVTIMIVDNSGRLKLRFLIFFWDVKVMIFSNFGRSKSRFLVALGARGPTLGALGPFWMPEVSF